MQQDKKRQQNIPVRKIVRQEQQIQEERQIPIESRTHINTTYEFRTEGRPMNPNPKKIETKRITNYNLNSGLNRQAAANTAVKIQTQGQVQPTRRYGYDSNLNNYQTNTSQDRSSRNERVYHYGVTNRRDFQGRNNQRGNNHASVDNTQNGRVQYRQIENENNQNRIYVSGSNSPGTRRYTSNREQSYYQSNIRGGVVKLRWKYTTQTEINKIIMIQRWWRYILLIKKEQQSHISENENSERTEKTEKSDLGLFEENERYGRHYAGYNYGYGEQAQYRTETKEKKTKKIKKRKKLIVHFSSLSKNKNKKTKNGKKKWKKN